LKKLINEEVSNQKEQAKKKNINIQVLCDESQLVLVDIEMLRIIIRNLLSNAIKFTNIDGKIEFNVFSNDNTTKMEIIDNGIGIKNEDKDKLFKIFSTFYHARN